MNPAAPLKSAAGLIERITGVARFIGVAMLPQPSAAEAPKYWTFETSGRLARAMLRYLSQEVPVAGDNDLIRAYLDQWVSSSAWDANPHLTDDGRETLKRLREDVKMLRKRAAFDGFIEELIGLGMDPL